MRATKEATAGRKYPELQREGRRTGRPTDELIQLYALECFLDRLARSEFSANFVLKGGVLLAALNARRPTRDIDFAARAINNDTDTVLRLVRRIAAVSLDDGVEFHATDAVAETIRDEEAYSGVRVTLTGTLSRASVRLHVDVNVGDPIWPEPQIITLPRLLDGKFSVPGYPLEMVLAEKIVTAIARGTSHSRASLHHGIPSWTCPTQVADSGHAARESIPRGGTSMQTTRKGMLTIGLTLLPLGVLSHSSKSAETETAAVGFQSDPSPLFNVRIPVGYRQWQLVAVSYEAAVDEFRGILGNAAAIAAYEKDAGSFPDGSVLAKLAWKRMPSAEFPGAFVPGAASTVQFMVKDSKRYASTGGWGFGRFVGGKPADEAQHRTCFACHQANVKDHDLVFTRYAP